MATISISGYDTGGISTLLNNYADGNTAVTKRLSTGRRASSAEDPAKDSLGARIEKTVAMLKSALEGTATAKAVAEVAEGAVSQIMKNVQELSSLSIRASNVVSDSDRALLDLQFQSLIGEIDRVARTTKFGAQVLLDGSLSGSNNVETDTNGYSDETKSYSEMKVQTFIESAPGTAVVNDEVSTLEMNGVRIKQVVGGAAANAFETLYASDEVVVTLNKGTAQNVEIFKLTGNDFSGGAAANEEVTFSTAAASANAADGAVAVANAANAIERAQFFADAINGVDGTVTAHAHLKKYLVATVSGDANEAKLVIKRIGTGGAGAIAFKASVEAGGTANLPDQIKSLAVGSARTDVRPAPVGALGVGGVAPLPVSEAAEYTAYNVAAVGEEITITEEVGAVGGAGALGGGFAKKIAALFQDPSAAPFKAQSTRDIISMYSAKVDPSSPTMVTISSKKQGAAGNFVVKNLEFGTSEMAKYSDGAAVGSLGVGSVYVSGGVAADAMIKNVGGSSASSGYVTINNEVLSNGSTIKFGGQVLTLKAQVKDATSEVQIKEGDATQTLKNLVKFLNSSNNPAFASFDFESQVVVGAGNNIENQLKITQKAYGPAYNGATMAISQEIPVAATDVKLVLNGGGFGGLDTATITDNPDFVGRIQGFKTSFEGTNKVKLQLTVGGNVYEGLVEDTKPATDTTIVMKSTKEGGGYLKYVLGGGRGMEVQSAADAIKFAEAADKSFEQLKFYQRRDVSSFAPRPGSSVDGMKAAIILGDYPKNLNVVDVKVVGSHVKGDATITVKTSDGKVFATRPNTVGMAASAGKRLELVEVTDSNAKMVLKFATDVDLSNEETTKRFEKDLTSAFKADLSPMQFQVGEGSDDIIGVSFADLRSETLFGDGKMSIATRSEMKRASEILAQAMTTVIESKAAVGGLLQALASTAGSLEQNIVTTKGALDVMMNVNITEELAKYTENNNKLAAGAFVFATTRQKSNELIATLFR